MRPATPTVIRMKIAQIELWAPVESGIRINHVGADWMDGQTLLSHHS